MSVTHLVRGPSHIESFRCPHPRCGHLLYFIEWFEYGCVISKKGGSPESLKTTEFYLTAGTNGTLSRNGGFLVDLPPGSLVSGKWHRIKFSVRDDTNATMRVNIDGARIGIGIVSFGMSSLLVYRPPWLLCWKWYCNYCERSHRSEYWWKYALF